MNEDGKAISSLMVMEAKSSDAEVFGHRVRRRTSQAWVWIILFSAFASPLLIGGWYRITRPIQKDANFTGRGDIVAGPNYIGPDYAWNFSLRLGMGRLFAGTVDIAKLQNSKLYSYQPVRSAVGWVQCSDALLLYATYDPTNGSSGWTERLYR